mmetsp:Transcript_34448/g.84740  ORF Transcript_34448/g.84740 Transcript_34448/m.84740 type:complete len:132 (+) Transcript_34448:34-429(+)
MKREFPRDAVKTAATYLFVGGLMIFLICVLAYTPSPAWMHAQTGDPGALGGNSSALAVRGVRQAQLANIPLNAGQIKAIVTARKKHGVFYNEGDRMMPTNTKASYTNTKAWSAAHERAASQAHARAEQQST